MHALHVEYSKCDSFDPASMPHKQLLCLQVHLNVFFIYGGHLDNWDSASFCSGAPVSQTLACLLAAESGLGE